MSANLQYKGLFYSTGTAIVINFIQRNPMALQYHFIIKIQIQAITTSWSSVLKRVLLMCWAFDEKGSQAHEFPCTHVSFWSSGHGKVHFHPGYGGHLLDKAQLQKHLPTRNEALRPCWSCWKTHRLCRGCAEAVGDRGERVLHQLIKVKGLVNVLRLDEQHESKVTLLTILYYLKKCEQLYRT